MDNKMVAGISLEILDMVQDGLLILYSDLESKKQIMELTDAGRKVATSLAKTNTCLGDVVGRLPSAVAFCGGGKSMP